MSKATPGRPYVTVKGDTLSGIARQAYGRGTLWRKIYAANQSKLKSGDLNLIFPGETINIPADDIVEKAKIDLIEAGLPKLKGKEKDDFTLVIEGVELKVQSGRVLRTMDTCADGWTAGVMWNFENKDWKKSLRPFSYAKADCYLGELLTVRGLLYNVKNRISIDGIFKSLEGCSFTADIIDSTTKPPYEQSKVTLEQRAKQLVEPLGISVVFEIDEDPIFDRVTIEPETTIFEHLAELASQRGVLISSTPLGELLFCNAAKGKPVGTISESVPPGQSIEIEFDGRKLFNAYRIIAQSPSRKNKYKGNLKHAIAKDDNVPRSRFMTFKADDVALTGLQKAADWKRSKQFADALTFPFPVSSWYAPDGTLWRENKLVTVVSKALELPDGFTFLIRSVEYLFDGKGTNAILQLVPPQVYTGETLLSPWSQ